MNNNNSQNGMSQRLKQMQMLEEYRKSKKKYGLDNALSATNDIRRFIGNTGRAAMNSSDPRTQALGSKMYRYSGQEFSDNFRQNPVDTSKNAWGSLKGKIGDMTSKVWSGKEPGTITGGAAPVGSDQAYTDMLNKAISNNKNTGIFGDTAKTYDAMKNITEAQNGISGAANSYINTGANSSSAIGSAINGTGNTGSALSSATKGATGAAGAAKSGLGAAGSYGGAALSGLSAVNNLANKNYTDAGIDAASTAASFIPVYGWAVAAALQAGKMIKNMIKGKKDEQAQKSAALSANATAQRAAENKEQAMEGLAKGAQGDQAPEQIQQTPDEIAQDIFKDYKNVHFNREDMTPEEIEQQDIHDRMNEIIENNKGKNLLKGSWGVFKDTLGYAKEMQDKKKQTPYVPQNEELAGYDQPSFALENMTDEQLDAFEEELKRRQLNGNSVFSGR